MILMSVDPITVRAEVIAEASMFSKFATSAASPVVWSEPAVTAKLPAVSAAPVAPGAGADFRLIFEGVTDAWNQQPPALQVTGVSTR